MKTSDIPLPALWKRQLLEARIAADGFLEQEANRGFVVRRLGLEQGFGNGGDVERVCQRVAQSDWAVVAVVVVVRAIKAGGGGEIRRNVSNHGAGICSAFEGEEIGERFHRGAGRAESRQEG